jgi:hypothetical protein
MIPETDPVTDTPERYVTEQQWETVYHDLQAVFGEADVFYFIDYADPSDTEPWKGSWQTIWPTSIRISRTLYCT